MTLTSTLFRYLETETLLLKQLPIFHSTGMILTFQQIQCYNQAVQALVSNDKLKRISVEDFLQFLSLC